MIRSSLTAFLTLLALTLCGCGESESPSTKEPDMYCGIFSQQLVENLIGDHKAKTADEDLTAERATCVLHDMDAGDSARPVVNVIAIPVRDEVARDSAQKENDEFVSMGGGREVDAEALADLGSGRVAVSEYDALSGQRMTSVSLAVITEGQSLRIIYNPTSGAADGAVDAAVAIAKDVDSNLAELQPSAESSTAGSRGAPSGTDDSVVISASKLASRLG